MATWWTLTFEGEPTEADYQRVSEMVAQGFTNGQLIEEPSEYGHLEAIEYVSHGLTSRNGQWVPGRFKEYLEGGRALVYTASGNGPVLSRLTEIRKPRGES